MDNSPGGQDQTQCPYCGEWILAVAKKCKFCKEWLNKPARRRASVRWDGPDVAMFPRNQIHACLPRDRCAVCAGDGRPGRLTMKNKKFIWSPPWIWIGLLGGLLPAAILQLAFQKTEHASFVICSPCKRTWFMWDALVILVGFGGIFAFPIMGAFIGEAITKDGGIAGVLLGLVVWFVALVVANWVIAPKHRISVKQIGDHWIGLKWPNPGKLRSMLAAQDKPPAGGPQRGNLG